MNDDVFVYDGSDEPLRRVYDLRNSGVRIVCPVCHANLIVGLDFETAGRLGVHPGIDCVEHPEHLSQRQFLRPSI